MAAVRDDLRYRRWTSYALGLFAFFYTNLIYAQSGPSNINVSGVLFDSTGTAITAPSVNFKIQLYDQNATCLLYSEDHLGLDLSQTKGGFSIDIGSGSSIQNLIDASSATAMSSKVYENPGAIAGGWSGCASGATLSDGDSRVIRIQYNLGGGYVTMNPDVPLASAAYATVAQTLQGKRPSDFIQVHNDVSNKLTQANVENVFSSINYPKLTDLLSGASTSYISSNPSAAVPFNSQRLTNVADPTAAQDAATKNYADSNLGGKTVDVSGVGPATGDGYTLIWDQATQTWTTGSPSATDNTKLLKAGDTMTGTLNFAAAIGTGINLNGNDLVGTGHITMSPLKTLTLGTFTTAQETTLVGTLTAANAGASWYNSTTKTFKIWDGTAAISQMWSGMTAGGDLTGTYPNPTIANDKITSAKVDSAGIGLNRLIISDQTTGTTLKFATCATNEVLRYEGVNGWTCRDPSSIVTFPVNSVNGKTGTVTLNANDLGLGTAALENVGTGAGEIPQLDAGGKIPASMIPAASSPTWGDITNGAGKYMTYKPNNTACANNEILKFDGTNWICADISSLGSGDFLKNGSIAMTGNFNAGGNSVLGNTTASANLILESTSNATKGSVLIQPNGGSVGIGTSAPDALLNLNASSGGQAPNTGSMLHMTGADGSSLALTMDAYGSDFYDSPYITLRKAQGTSAAPTASLVNDILGEVQMFGWNGTTWSTGGYIELSAVENWSGTASGTKMIFTTVKKTTNTATASMTLSGNGIAANGNFLAANALDVNGGAVIGGSYIATKTAPTNGLLVEGNVGIGTDNPARALHVNGAARFTPTTTPATPAAGDVFFDSAASNALKFYDGSAWQTVGTGTGSGDFMKNGSVAMTGNFNAGGNSVLGNSTASANLKLESTSNATKGDVLLQPNGGGVGIGTSAVNGALLQLYQNDGAGISPFIRIENAASSNAGNGSRIDFRFPSNVASGTIDSVFDDGVNNASLRFQTMSTGGLAERLRVNPNGMRLAPSTLPSSPAAGDIAIDSAASNALKFYNGSAWQTVGTGTGTGDFLKDGSVAMTGNFNAGGNSILGNTTASANLTLESTSNATKGYVNIQPNGGNVGVGTATPAYTLDVRTGSSRSQLHISSSSADDGAYLQASDANTTYFTGGTANDGSNWIAKASTASIIGNENGGFSFYSNSGLTPGNSFSPTLKMNLNPSGILRLPAGGAAIIGDTGTPSGTLEVVETSTSSPRGIVSTQVGTTAVGANFTGKKARGNIGSLTTVMDGDGLAGFVPSPYDGSSFLSPANLGFIVNGTVATGSVPTDFFVNTGSSGTSGGVERLRITSAGNVGIGTTTPARLLHVNGAARFTPTTTPSSAAAGDMFFDSAASNALKFYDGSAWQTVGTATGSGDFKKDGSVAMTGNFNAGGNSILGNTTASSNLTLESTSNASKGYVNIQPNGGNVGIGTTAPTGLLHVAGGPVSGANGKGITLQAQSASALSYDGGDIVLNPGSAAGGGGRSGNVSVNGLVTNQPAALNVTSTADTNYNTLNTYAASLADSEDAGHRLYLGYDYTIDAGVIQSAYVGVGMRNTIINPNGGNLGIGTTTPARLLQVNGAARFTPTTTPGSPAAGDLFFDSAASNALKFYDGSAWQTVGTATGSGDFKKDGSVAMTGNFNAGGNSILGNTTASSNLTLESTSNASKGYVNIQPNGGNVGIGTTSPAASLEVMNNQIITYPVNDAWGANLIMRKSRAGSIVQNNDEIGYFRFDGYDGASYKPAAAIDANVDGTPGTNDMPTRLSFSTTPDGAAALVERMRITNAGNVGIGTTSPAATLDVNGVIKSVAVSNASASVDFGTGNLQYTSVSCGAITLNNMKSGATYSLAVQGTSGGTCSFTAYSGNGTGALTVKTGTVNLSQTASKDVIFSFMVMGSVVYVTAADGY